MKPLLCLCLLAVSLLALADEIIIHDDGTGAQISYCLPVHDKWQGKDVEYTTFRISVGKNDKFLLLTNLSGNKTDDGDYFVRTIIIPSDFIASAEILFLGSPLNSTNGLSKKLKVSDFKRIVRERSWTEQK